LAGGTEKSSENLEKKASELVKVVGKRGQVGPYNCRVVGGVERKCENGNGKLGL